MRLLIDVNYIFISVILISFTVGASGTTVMEQFWNVPQYFDQKLKSNGTPDSIAELNLIEDTPSPVEFHRKMHLGTFHAKFGYRSKSTFSINFLEYFFLSLFSCNTVVLVNILLEKSDRITKSSKWKIISTEFVWRARYYYFNSNSRIIYCAKFEFNLILQY